MGDVASLKVARRKLNTIGNMHGNCDVLNGSKNLKHIRNDLQLTDAIAKIFHGDAEESASKREEEEGNLIGGATSAANKLKDKNQNVSALTAKEIKSLLFGVNNVTMSANDIRTPDYVDCLMAYMEKDITKYEIFLQ